MLFRPFPLIAAIGSLTSCSPAPVDGRFDETGELIALSGGDAGPQAACHNCHGLDGGGDGALVPRIAGIDAGYLVRQLGFYADGQRRHPQMTWLASRLDDADRLAVSTFYAGMPIPETERGNDADICTFGDAATIYHNGIPDRDLASCAYCHGEEGEGVGAGNPSLVGQSAAYTAEQLRRWRTGERFGDPLKVMHDAAGKLRDNEISPLAGYIAYGPGRSHRPGFLVECP